MSWLIKPPTLAEVAPDLLLVIDTADMSRQQRERLRAAVWRELRPTTRWASPVPGVHVIDGARLTPGQAGLDAAWCAVAAPGRHLVRAADFCSPGAQHPAQSMRGALKRAAAFLGPINPALADAVRSITVEGEHLVYRPSGRVDIVTS